MELDQGGRENGVEQSDFDRSVGADWIHLGVIEAAEDAAAESWRNLNPGSLSLAGSPRP